MTTQSAARLELDLSNRNPLPLGGFNLTIVGLELKRLVRNKRTVIFTLGMPVVFLFLFGNSGTYAPQSVGAGGHGNWAAFSVISMALYGSILATTSGGAMVSVERAAGWSRQLRLTPLSAAAYIGVKMVSAMTLGLASLVGVYIAATFTQASMPLHLWIITGLLVWVLSLVFAAFGLFMGLLLPSENVMQILGPVLALLAFGGGLFIPLSVLGENAFTTIAKFVPTYGVSGLAHAPLTGESIQIGWVLNVVVWLAIFVAGAIWRFRKDTARV